MVQALVCFRRLSSLVWTTSTNCAEFLAFTIFLSSNLFDMLKSKNKQKLTLRKPSRRRSVTTSQHRGRGPIKPASSDKEDAVLEPGDDEAVTGSASESLSAFRTFVKSPHRHDETQTLIQSLTSSELLRSPGHPKDPGLNSESFSAANAETNRGLMRTRCSKKSTASGSSTGKGKAKLVCCPLILNPCYSR